MYFQYERMACTFAMFRQSLLRRNISQRAKRGRRHATLDSATKNLWADSEDFQHFVRTSELEQYSLERTLIDFYRLNVFPM